MIQSVSNQTQSLTQQQQSSNNYMFVGPYRLEKTLGKGQTGKFIQFHFNKNLAYIFNKNK